MGDQEHEELPGRLGITFHRTFSLSRPGLTQVMDLDDIASGRKLERSAIRANTNLGPIYVEAMPRYGYGAGLLDENKRKTIFGSFASKYDCLLEQAGTQWLMHYFLSAPHGPGPVFWHELVTCRFRSGDHFSTDEITEQIADVFQRLEGKPLANRSARSTATVFLGTYTKPDALGKLGILEETGHDFYRVLEPEPPPVWAVAYALLDYWKGQFGHRSTVNLDDLYSERGLSHIFMIGPGRMGGILRAMQEEGYVDVYRVAPPYQVVLLNSDISCLLEKLYGNLECE